MAIQFTGTGGLFTQLGQLGYAMYQSNIYQATNIPAYISGILAQYETQYQWASSIPNAQITAQQAVIGTSSIWQNCATQTLQGQVNLAVPAQSGSILASLNECIAEMTSGNISVKQCNVGSSQTTVASSVGNGVLVANLKRGDGLFQQNTFPELTKIICTSDAQTGGASAGSETFTFTGGIYTAGGVFNFDYPSLGSGSSGTIQAVNGHNSQSGNVLNNSGWDSFTSNSPTYWTLEVGTAGLDVKPSSAVVYDSYANSLQIVGSRTGSGSGSSGTSGSSSSSTSPIGTLVALSQTFGQSTGTTSTLIPLRSYAINFFAYLDVLPASGTLIVELVDQYGNVQYDAQGTPDQYVIPLTSGFTAATWQNFNVVFRTPRVMPLTYKLRIRLGSGLSVGSNLYLSRLAMVPLTALYPGGPGIAIFSGSTNFILNDGFNLTTTNDRGGSSYGATFQCLFDRFFGMRGLGLLLPYSASPTISDTLITV